jgi:4-diphosphocytidyl-2-C-methyl-D-erythritol kinase
LLIIKSHAKINLFLDVLGKRADGYHELDTIFQAISLHDTLTFEEAPDISLVTPHAALSSKKNTILQAAHMLQAVYPQVRARITLEKRIPIGSGLGGGSSNAAATLMALRDMFRLPATNEALRRMGAAIGADVPFFIRGESDTGTARAHGIGEKLSPLPAIPPCYIVIVPGVYVSTAAAFAALPAESHARGDISQIFSAISNKNLHQMAASVYNVFQEGTPAVHQTLNALLQCGALGAALSGTGGAVFGIFEAQQAAGQACDTIKTAILCTPVQ